MPGVTGWALLLLPRPVEEDQAMRTPQLLVCSAVATLAAAAGCNRADADRNARDAAAEVRTAATAAGERLADGWLTTKIQAQFFADDDIKARYINVTSKDGVVRLHGFVETPVAREQALAIARNTDGVLRVDDELMVGVAPNDDRFATSEPNAVATTGDGSAAYDEARAASAAVPAPQNDEQITSMVQARFFLEPTIKTRAIDVTTSNGVVTLRGRVANEKERSEALLIARNTTGVGRVEDSLTVDTALP
jgi:osmotically-inducible protein OsmY